MRFGFYASALVGTTVALQVQNEYSMAFYEDTFTPAFTETSVDVYNEDESEFLSLAIG